MASFNARNVFYCDENCQSPHVQVHEGQFKMGLVHDESQPCLLYVTPEQYQFFQLPHSLCKDPGDSLFH